MIKYFVKILFIFSLLLFLLGQNLTAQTAAKGRPITLIGFGVPVDVPGSYGDTWATAWSADDSVFIMANDGYGITRGNLRGSIGNPSADYIAHCIISWLPPSFSPENFASIQNQRDGRRNIHPVSNNDFTRREFQFFQNPYPWYPYSTDIYEVDGVLYINFVHSYQIPGNWGFLYSNFMRSTDGGRTWQNYKGEIDTPTAPNWGDAFFPQGWEHVEFVKYGKGGVAPNVDRAQEFVYIFSQVDQKYNPPGGAGLFMARIKRSDLREWKTSPDGNGDNVRKKVEYLSYGWVNTERDAQAVLNDSHWTTDYDRAKPIGWGPYTTIVYNETLRRYFGTSFHCDSFDRPIKEASIEMYEAPFPWGPWKSLLQENTTTKANDNLTLLFLSQKYISSDGYKMWIAANGDQIQNSYTNRNGYFLKFIPAYLTSEPVQNVRAIDSSRVSVNGLTQATHREHEWVTGRFGANTTGYGNFTRNGASITFTVNAPTAGDYIVNFRYRTKGVPPWTTMEAYRRDPFPTISLYVNNSKVKQLRLARSIQTYAEWTEMSIFLRLNAGNNTVTFQRDAGDVSDTIVIASLTYARYTGSSPLPLDNAGTQSNPVASTVLPSATDVSREGTPAVISRWAGSSDNNSSINARTANETIDGQRFSTLIISGTLAPNSYALALGTPNSAALRNMRTMTSFSFKVLGDGNDYIVLLPTRETNQVSDHYLKSFSTTNGEVITITINVSDLVQGGHSGRPVEFNQNNITNIQFQPITPGTFNLKIWDIRTD